MLSTLVIETLTLRSNFESFVVADVSNIYIYIYIYIYNYIHIYNIIAILNILSFFFVITLVSGHV